MLCRYYGQGNITEDNYIQFIKHDTLSSEYLNQSKNFVVYVRENFEILKNQGSEYWTWQSSREQVIYIFNEKSSQNQRFEAGRLETPTQRKLTSSTFPPIDTLRISVSFCQI